MSTYIGLCGRFLDIQKYNVNASHTYEAHFNQKMFKTFFRGHHKKIQAHQFTRPDINPDLNMFQKNIILDNYDNNIIIGNGPVQLYSSQMSECFTKKQNGKACLLCACVEKTHYLLLFGQRNPQYVRLMAFGEMDSCFFNTMPSLSVLEEVLEKATIPFQADPLKVEKETCFKTIQDELRTATLQENNGMPTLQKMLAIIPDLQKIQKEKCYCHKHFIFLDVKKTKKNINRRKWKISPKCKHYTTLIEKNGIQPIHSDGSISELIDSKIHSGCFFIHLKRYEIPFKHQCSSPFFLIIIAQLQKHFLKNTGTFVLQNNLVKVNKEDDGIKWNISYNPIGFNKNWIQNWAEPQNISSKNFQCCGCGTKLTYQGEYYNHLEYGNCNAMNNCIIRLSIFIMHTIMPLFTMDIKTFSPIILARVKNLWLFMMENIATLEKINNQEEEEVPKWYYDLKKIILE